MTNSPIVITGIGITSPLGLTTQTTWDNLLAGHSGLDEIKSFDASGFPSRTAAEIIDFPEQPVKFATKFTRFALTAAEEALTDAGVRPDKQTANHWGLVAGSGMMTAEYDYWQRFQHQFAPDGKVDTAKMGTDARSFYRSDDFGSAVSNSGLSLLAQQFNIRGYANSVHTACASGGQAMGLALQAMRRGEVKQMLVGGFDSMINPFGLASFCLLGALSTHNDTPKTASRPFDQTRNGFVLGEGAAFLVLEHLDSAIQRGAKIYAELAGEGNTISAYRITDSHPDGDGARQAIKMALDNAGLKPEDIDYINAHGTSTQMNDLSEARAIQAEFGEHTQQVWVSSTKGQTGHLIAGAGAIEAAISALSLYHQTMPYNTNLTQPDPECALNFILDKPRSQSINAVLSNSFGFGGSNSCLVLRRVA